MLSCVLVVMLGVVSVVVKFVKDRKLFGWNVRWGGRVE